MSKRSDVKDFQAAAAVFAILETITDSTSIHRKHKRRAVADSPNSHGQQSASGLSLIRCLIGALRGRVGGILVGSRLRDRRICSIDLILRGAVAFELIARLCS